jgi:hypothetical protein
MRRFTLAVAALVLPFIAQDIAQAQIRGAGAAGGGHAVISAPRAAYAGSAGHATFAGAPVRPAGTVTSGRRTFSTRPAPRAASTASTLSAFGPVNSLPDFTGAVPGLGFDFAHFAAVHPGLNSGLNNRRRGNFGRQGFFPFFDGGFLLPYAGGYLDADDEPGPYDSGQQTQPAPQAAANGPEPDDDLIAARRSQAFAAQPVSGYDVVVEPQKPSEQYVFVRRDGSVFFAVAYSWQAGNLYYVTQEGLRRSVAREALDLDATQQFNQQRGLTFLAPA